jgi:amino acid transporter
MSPEAKLSWVIAGIAVALFVLIMAWLFTAVEKSGSLVKDAHHHTPETTHP